MEPTIRVVSELSSVDPAAWDRLDHGPSPFLEYGFLRALDESQSIGGESGWDPFYVLAEVPAEPSHSGSAEGAKRLVGAVPCFAKHHSYGEYIFDFGWARASMRAGVPYYPKLVIAAPVTPATGPRILLDRSPTAPDPTHTARLLVAAVRELADRLGCSSVHWLFVTRDERDLLTELGYLPRASFQFHFQNPGYESFDAFLATLASRKRKQIKKERRRAAEAVDEIEFVAGTSWTDEDVRHLDGFYRRTVHLHGGQDYLRPGFFEALREHQGHRAQFVRVRKDEQTIAGALYMETRSGLYGRYWGCSREIDFLHFEVAYYQGVQRCIEQGIPLFEAGAQGEHKLLRGFAPAPTYSAHWIRHAGLRDAVRRFVEEEAAALPPYMRELERYTPFKRKE